MSTRILRSALCIAPTHACLVGHFPGRPLVPAVLLETHRLRMVGLPEAKFLAPLAPGVSAELEVEAIDATQWRFRISHADTLIARGRVQVVPA